MIMSIFNIFLFFQRKLAKNLKFPCRNKDINLLWKHSRHHGRPVWSSPVNSKRPGTITRPPCLKPVMMAAMREFCRKTTTSKASICSAVETATTIAKSLKWTLIYGLG